VVLGTRLELWIASGCRDPKISKKKQIANRLLSESKTTSKYGLKAIYLIVFFSFFIGTCLGWDLSLWCNRNFYIHWDHEQPVLPGNSKQIFVAFYKAKIPKPSSLPAR